MTDEATVLVWVPRRLIEAVHAAKAGSSLDILDAWKELADTILAALRAPVEVGEGDEAMVDRLVCSARLRGQRMYAEAVAFDGSEADENEDRSALLARLAQLRAEAAYQQGLSDTGATILGRILVACTLRSGETLAEDHDDAATQAVLGVLRERDAARTLAEATAVDRDEWMNMCRGAEVERDDLRRDLDAARAEREEHAETIMRQGHQVAAARRDERVARAEAEEAREMLTIAEACRDERTAQRDALVREVGNAQRDLRDARKAIDREVAEVARVSAMFARTGAALRTTVGALEQALDYRSRMDPSDTAQIGQARDLGEDVLRDLARAAGEGEDGNG